MTESITIEDAANRLDVKPWDVVRLVEAGLVKHVVLIDAASLSDYQEQQA